MLRVIEAVRPRWVIGENVRNFVSMEMGLERSISDLENAGYAVEAFLLGAVSVGAPHRRDRCWVVANTGHRRGRDIGASERGEGRKGKRSSKGTGTQREWGRSTNGGEDVADADIKGFQERERKDTSGAQSIGWSKLERGFRWLPEPEFRGVSNGLSEKLDGGGLNAREWMDKEPQGINEASMRVLWGNGKSALTPQQPRSDEQLTRQLADALRQLPHEMALGTRQDGKAVASAYVYRLRQSSIQIGAVQHPPDSTEALWLSLPDEDAREWSRLAAYLGPFHTEWPGTPRISHGVKNRVHRLKCLGNSVVPQVVERIGYAILEAEGMK